MATNNAINGVTGSKITKYTASDTWTKDVNTQYVYVYVWNGGGGGASGRQATSTTSGGGGGGASGGVCTWSGYAGLLGSTETVTVAAGGSGGATQASATSNGNPGGLSPVSSFGRIKITSSATQSVGGTVTTAAAGANNVFFIYNMGTNTSVQLAAAGNGGNVAGSNASPSGATGSIALTMISQQVGTGGGGGSGADAVVARQAGNGGDVVFFGANLIATPEVALSGGAGGISTGTIDGGAGTDAVNASGGIVFGGTGGGGGGGMVAGVAGNGGNGGIPSGGGGGGGGSINGTTSGAGGDGGRGEVWVIEIY